MELIPAEGESVAVFAEGLTNEELLVFIRSSARIGGEHSRTAAQHYYACAAAINTARDRGRDFLALAGFSNIGEFVNSIIALTDRQRSTMNNWAIVQRAFPELPPEIVSSVPVTALHHVALNAPESAREEWLARAREVSVEELKREMRESGHGDEVGAKYELTGPLSQIQFIRKYLELPATKERFKSQTAAGCVEMAIAEMAGFDGWPEIPE